MGCQVPFNWEEEDLMSDPLKVTSWRALPLKEAYRFGGEHGLGDDISAIREMVIEWDRSYTSSLRRGYVVELFKAKGLFQSFKDTCWPNGNTTDGERLIRRYRRIKQQYDDFLSGVHTEVEDEDVSEQEFAYESDLRDFLARNLSTIEPGLELFRHQDKDGVEYPVQGGRIDILAKDAGDRFVVIELKVSRGRNATIGQLLYYMGWVDRNLSSPERSRGIIIAKEIPEALRVASGRVPGVSLYEYAISVKARKVYPA